MMMMLMVIEHICFFYWDIVNSLFYLGIFFCLILIDNDCCGRFHRDKEQGCDFLE